jgi:hypothetical protein
MENRFYGIVIITLLIFLFLKESGCYTPKPIISDTTRKTEVHFHYHDSSLVSIPKTTNSIVPVYIPQQYQPDTSSIHALRMQYEDLVKKFLTKNVTSDTLKVDTLGYVAVTDTISENNILKRRWDYSLKEKVITNTISIENTIPEKKRNQLYIGPGIAGYNNVNSFNINLGLKTKQDKLFLIKGGIFNNNGVIQPQFGGAYLWKIKL